MNEPTDKPLLCPFCGQSPERNYANYVFCGTRGCVASIKAFPIEVWNTCALPPVASEEWRMLKAGEWIITGDERLHNDDIWRACAVFRYQVRESEVGRFRRRISAQPTKPEGGERELTDSITKGVVEGYPSDPALGAAKQFFFSYDPDNGFDFHDSAEEAKLATESYFQYCSDEASCDGWPEETDRACWGVISERVTLTKSTPRPTDSELDEEHEDGEGNDWSNPDWSRIDHYELRAQMPTSLTPTVLAQTETLEAIARQFWVGPRRSEDLMAALQHVQAQAVAEASSEIAELAELRNELQATIQMKDGMLRNQAEHCQEWSSQLAERDKTIAELQPLYEQLVSMYITHRHLVRPEWLDTLKSLLSPRKEKA